MLINNRLKNILDIIENEGGSRVADLSRQLNVSEATIRRDLDALKVENRIKRVHGGAIMVDRQPFELPVQKRIRENDREKQAIGRETAALIENKETIFLGSGTTTLEVAKHLINRKDLTVITNSLLVAQLFSTSSVNNLIFLGGFLRSSELSFIGHITEQAIKEVRVDKIVIGIPAIDVKVGLTNDYLPEVRTDRAILGMGDKLIVVADHTKIGKVASAYLAPFSRITTFVTDNQIDSDTLDRIRAEGIEVIIAAYKD